MTDDAIVCTVAEYRELSKDRSLEGRLRCPMCFTTDHNGGMPCSVCNPVYKKVKE